MVGDEFFDPPVAVKGDSLSDNGELALLSRWECLRLSYNRVLASEVLVLCVLIRSELLEDRRFWGYLILRGIAANLCFCAGPVADGYAHRLGFGSRVTTTVIFRVGTGLAVLLAGLSVFFYGPSGI